VEEPTLPALNDDGLPSVSQLGVFFALLSEFSDAPAREMKTISPALFQDARDIEELIRQTYRLVLIDHAARIEGRSTIGGNMLPVDEDGRLPQKPNGPSEYVATGR